MMYQRIDGRPKLRVTLPIVCLVGSILAAQPAAAATGLANIDRSALAMMTAFAVLFLAIVFEAARIALRTPSPAKRRDERHWNRGRHNG